MSNLVIVESRLKGATAEEQRENLRYLLWACRAEYLAGNRPIASHLICPWFMNDEDPKERAHGIAWPWMWMPGVRHHFWIDNGESVGMEASKWRCAETLTPYSFWRLKEIPELWARYEAGEWPPHTVGFEVAR